MTFRNSNFTLFSTLVLAGGCLRLIVRRFLASSEMMTNSVVVSMQVFAVSIFAGCANQPTSSQTLMGSVPATRIRPTAAPRRVNPAAKSKTIISEWRFGDLIYRNRNGDGAIDWMEQSESGVLDGVGLTREDTDFDGVFDREHVGHGLAGSDHRSIDIPIPPHTQSPTTDSKV